MQALANNKKGESKMKKSDVDRKLERMGKETVEQAIKTLKKLEHAKRAEETFQSIIAVLYMNLQNDQELAQKFGLDQHEKFEEVLQNVERVVSQQKDDNEENDNNQEE